MIPSMKCNLRWLALAAMTLSLSSCGIPQLLGRTISNTVQQVGALAR